MPSPPFNSSIPVPSKRAVLLAVAARIASCLKMLKVRYTGCLAPRTDQDGGTMNGAPSPEPMPGDDTAALTRDDAPVPGRERNVAQFQEGTHLLPDVQA